MFQKKSSLFVFSALLILALGGYTLDTSRLEARTQNQTIPTRTPIPEPTEPNSGGSNNGGSNNGGGSTSPTNTPTPENTATPTAVPVTIAATPAGGFITPETCGQPFFISVEGNTNVRQGPDATNERIGQLVYLEARAVIGRSADLEWWYIEIATGQKGWVADIAGDVQGNISGVPLVDENGAIVNTTPLWNPTPNPDCPTMTPTATAVPPTETPIPPTATAVPETETEQAATAGDDSTTESTVEVAPTETAVPPTETPAPPTTTPTATIEPTATAEPTEVVTSEIEPEQPATEATEDTTPSESPSGINWILVSGATLLGIGGGAYFIQGRGKG